MAVVQAMVSKKVSGRLKAVLNIGLFGWDPSVTTRVVEVGSVFLAILWPG